MMTMARSVELVVVRMVPNEAVESILVVAPAVATNWVAGSRNHSRHSRCQFGTRLKLIPYVHRHSSHRRPKPACRCKCCCIYSQEVRVAVPTALVAAAGVTLAARRALEAGVAAAVVARLVAESASAATQAARSTCRSHHSQNRAGIRLKLILYVHHHSSHRRPRPASQCKHCYTRSPVVQREVGSWAILVAG